VNALWAAERALSRDPRVVCTLRGSRLERLVPLTTIGNNESIGGDAAVDKIVGRWRGRRDLWTECWQRYTKHNDAAVADVLNH